MEQVECPVCHQRVELLKVEDEGDHKRQYYSCGHSNRFFQRSIDEPTVVIKDEVSWVKRMDAIGLVTRAAASKNYYEALSLACSYFQDYGKEILKWDSQKTGNKISKSELKNMDLNVINRKLYDRNLID
jgi:hypothetical protein